jgi:hypothetical protein
MNRPAFPALVALVEVRGCQPQVVPLRGLPDWYAVAIPAGHSAYILAPDANATTVEPDQVEAYVDEAAKRGIGGLFQGRWSVRVTRGAWARLEAVKPVLVDVLGTFGILPMEPGRATVGDRARLLARTWTRRLLANPRQGGADSSVSTPVTAAAPGNSAADERIAHQPLSPVGPTSPRRNGELKHLQIESQGVLSTEEPRQDE